MSERLLSLEGIVKTYLSGQRQIRVLQGVSLSVDAGDSVSIRGESGSGKSTLLNLLTGLDQADEGSVRWRDDQPVDGRVRGREIGIIFQSFYLIPELTAFDNVLMARRIIGPVREEDRQRARDLLRDVGLQDRLDHVPTQLSGGERQRVAVARALMNRPRLIVADEPTGNLDEQTGEKVIETLFSLCSASGTALVLVTHNPAHAQRAVRRFHLIQGVLYVLQ